MKNLMLIFLIITLGLFSCTKSELNSPLVELDKSYKIAHNGKQAIGFLDSIKFNSNGTYIRSEFTTSKMYNVGELNGTTMIFLEKISGTWAENKGQLELTDEIIIDFHCKSWPYATLMDCPMESHEIVLGLSEWYKGFKAEIGNDTIRLESSNDRKKRLTKEK